MKKLVGLVAVAGLLVGMLAAPSSAEVPPEWREQVIVERELESGYVLRITTRYDAARRRCVDPDTVLDSPVPIPDLRCLRYSEVDKEWLSDDESQEASLEIAVVRIVDGKEAGKTAVVVPFAGQFVP